MQQMHEAFSDWNQGVLDSYLIEITADILAKQDEDGTPLVSKILDTAGQKGTGKWTGISALDLGVPLTLIGEAVFARVLSSLKEERIRASAILGPESGEPIQRQPRLTYVQALHDALYASKIISYAQGFMLMREAAKEQGWDLNYGEIALMWRGGCIIRSKFLGNIKSAFDNNPQLDNLVLDEFFTQALLAAEAGWRKAVIAGGGAGHRRPRVRLCPGLLRWLSQRPLAGQSAAGATGLFRRPHLRTGRSAARRIFSHRLDRSRR